MKRGQIVELEMEKFADRGKSLARVDGGYVVFVKRAVPGDKVRVKITKKKKSYAEGYLIEVLEPSPLRTEPRCFYFETCGGCKWQNVQYQEQLDAKQQSVEEALVHQGGFEDVEVRPTLGSDDIYFYRNKMEFSFSTNRWLTPEEIETGKEFDTDFALGLHVPGNFFKVLDLHECYLQSELSAKIVNGVRNFVKAHGWKPWDIREHHGFLRHLVIRSSHHTDDLMVNLVTNGHDEERMQQLAQLFEMEFPQVTTFVNTVNTGVAQTSHGEKTITIFGSGLIRDEIGGHTFEISPHAFFQTNTRGAEKLYQVAREFADLREDDTVYDLYCGAGTISLFLADGVERVIGVDLVEDAIENANSSAEANGVENCTFIAGDLNRMFDESFVAEHGEPDVLIVDPPRAGLHPDVVKEIGRLAPERFVYVSCNPQTQARDLEMLSETYAIDAVQPVDMFPHTHHIENVIKLVRRDG